MGELLVKDICGWEGCCGDMHIADADWCGR